MEVVAEEEEVAAAVEVVVVEVTCRRRHHRVRRRPHPNPTRIPRPRLNPSPPAHLARHRDLLDLIPQDRAVPCPNWFW